MVIRTKAVVGFVNARGFGSIIPAQAQLLPVHRRRVNHSVAFGIGGGGRLAKRRSAVDKPCRLDRNWIDDLDDLVVAQTVEVRVRPVWIL